MHRILEMIAAGETRFDMVARELGITNSMLAAKLEMLGRMGYVKDITDVCGSDPGVCKGCPSASHCSGNPASSSGNPGIYILTDKGKAVLGMNENKT